MLKRPLESLPCVAGGSTKTRPAALGLTLEHGVKPPMPFCYTGCPRVPQAAGGHTEQGVSTWSSGDLSLFRSQTCPHSKDPVWSQVFSFFVHSVAAEQLCLKVCLKRGSADAWESARPRTGESFLCTLGSSGSQPHSAWEGARPHKPSVP